MAKQKAGEASLDQLPSAYRKGHDKPIGWKAGARCAAERTTVRTAEGGKPSIWQIEAKKVYIVADEEVDGDTLIEVACKHCAVCAVQWDCARFAVACEEDFGTWSMRLEDLLWIRAQPNPNEIIATAEAAGRAMQFVVAEIRSC